MSEKQTIELVLPEGFECTDLKLQLKPGKMATRKPCACQKKKVCIKRKPDYCPPRLDGEEEIVFDINDIARTKNGAIIIDGNSVNFLSRNEMPEEYK